MDNSNNNYDVSNNMTEDSPEENTCVKHLVCSGGGLNGFVFYSVFKEAHKRNIWSLQNIETYYGTSVGKLLAH